MPLRRLAVLVMVLALLVVPNASAANWYAGAQRPNSYGMWAYIKTPAVAPYLVAAGQSGQSNWVSTPAPNWIQAGWNYYSGWSMAMRYVETCINKCFGPPPRFYQEYGTQSWGTTVDYLVQFTAGTTDEWCAYIAGSQKRCQSILTPPTTVQVYSEIHAYPLNGLETAFNPVYYKDSAAVWRLFDQSTVFPTPDFPYKRLVFQNWDFLTYRAVTFQRYVPLVLK